MPFSISRVAGAGTGGEAAEGRAGTGKADARGGGGGGGAGGGPGGGPRRGAPPRSDIPDGSDDDLVARQLREAAEKESDPELRNKLWEEYRRYKEGVR